MKQTAVEWLANELFKQLTGEPDKISLKEVLEQAKEMEKQQEKSYSEELEKVEAILLNIKKYPNMYQEGATDFYMGQKVLLEQFKNK
jgi:hypothetical protein